MNEIGRDIKSDLNRRHMLSALGGGVCAAAAAWAVQARAQSSQTSPSFPAIIESREFAVCFDNGSGVLSQSGLDVINDALRFIQAWANAPDGPVYLSRLVIVGHSDTGESAADLVTLSETRADRVADKLVELGVPPDKIAVDWKGDTQPSDWLDGKTQAAANRRVTIDPIF